MSDHRSQQLISTSRKVGCCQDSHARYVQPYIQSSIKENKLLTLLVRVCYITSISTVTQLQAVFCVLSLQ